MKITQMNNRILILSVLLYTFILNVNLKDHRELTTKPASSSKASSSSSLNTSISNNTNHSSTSNSDSHDTHHTSYSSGTTYTPTHYYTHLDYPHRLDRNLRSFNSSWKCSECIYQGYKSCVKT